MFGLVILLMFSSIGFLHGQLSLSSLPCRTYSKSINSNNRHLRIIGGSDATRGSFPFIASLTRRGAHHCGATILNEQWLITAAHCICNGFGDIMPAKRIKTVLGLYKVSEWKSDTANDNIPIDNRPYEMSIQNVFVHPEYDCKRPDNDIALLQMSQPIEFSSSVQPMCIANNKMNGNATYESASVTIAGWGNVKEEIDIGNRADTLQNAIVKVWNNHECQASFEQMAKNRKINPTQMCAGKKIGGIDACWADSGGPMIFDNHLIGIVSTGIGCARAGLPGIYTRVSSYTDWIENVIMSN